MNISSYKKFDEVPYDFKRKRLSVVNENNQHIMITKGTEKNIVTWVAAFFRLSIIRSLTF
ncbi:MAG: hypothetical protein ABJA35_10645 [Parafilimonas sp.]